MIFLEDLHKTWSIIAKNRDMKTDAQLINFFRSAFVSGSIFFSLSAGIFSRTKSQITYNTKSLCMLRLVLHAVLFHDFVFQLIQNPYCHIKYNEKVAILS